jgi:ABC-type transporter Mla subunit MlaD
MAKRKHVSELTAGLFVVIGLAVVLSVVIWLGASDLLMRSRGQIWLYVEQSAGWTGLEPGQQVYVGSVPAGRISRVRFEPETGRTFFRVDLEIPDLKIRSDAEIVYVEGVLGGSRVDVLSAGSAEDVPDSPQRAVALRAGGPMGAIQELSGRLSDELDANAPESLLGKIHAIVDDLQDAAGTVTEIAAGVQGQLDADAPNALLGKIHRTLDDINAMSETLRGEFDANTAAALLAKVHVTADDINRVTASLARQSDPGVAGSLLDHVRGIVTDVHEVTKDIKPRVIRLATNAEVTSARLREYVEYDVLLLLIDLQNTGKEILQLSRNFAELSRTARDIVKLNRGNIDEMIDNMTTVSADLKAAAKEIRRNPWRLLYTPKKEEIHSQNVFAAARSFSTAAEQLDQALAKLRAADPDRLDDEELQKIREHLRESFENFSKAEQALWQELRRAP